MSRRLISRSPDLKRLRDEGYDIEIQATHLVVHHVPYLNARREVAFGTLISVLTLNNDVTVRPADHVIFFAGDYPCDVNGVEISAIRHGGPSAQRIAETEVKYSFSNKPPGGFENYYQKITSYVSIIAGPAQAVDRTATAQTFEVVDGDGAEGPFTYSDSASSRAGIDAVSGMLAAERVAIVGLGGAGSYLLDFVAKTHAATIHLFDGDKFLQHNAFRAPGAPSREDLEPQHLKVNFFRDKYASMRRGIVAHEVYLCESNVELLDDMTFVFISMDGGADKRAVIERLTAKGIPFIDVGIGIELVDGKLTGNVRVTTSAPGGRDGVAARGRIWFSSDDGENEYARNIQVAELNALNAALAVIKWKKLRGVYHDDAGEQMSVFVLAGNVIVNDDTA